MIRNGTKGFYVSTTEKITLGSDEPFVLEYTGTLPTVFIVRNTIKMFINDEDPDGRMVSEVATRDLK